MRVLLVSQAYPPFPIVGALRARKIAQMFRARGHEVTVITERLPQETGDIRPGDAGVVVRTVYAGLPYRLRLVALRNRMLGHEVELSSWDGPSSAPAAGGAPPRGVRAGLGTLKRLAIGLLRLPDDQQQFVPPALRAGRLAARDGVDIVYTTAPSFSTHFIGLLLRRRGGLRWIAEYRDPWTVERPPRDRAPVLPILQRANRWMERRCLARADVIVAVTESVGRQLAAKLPPGERGKVVVAMSGIDRLEPRRDSPPRESQPYSIVHTGSFYHDRDPRPFLNALASWMRDNALGPADVRVDFAGRCRHYADVSVEQIVHELGLDDVVRFHDWLAHDEVQRMLAAADLVLLLARSQPAQVPNKLFEYLGARAPILAVVDEGGESAKILEAVGGQHVVTAAEGSTVTEASMRRALECAYRRRDEPAVTDEAALEALLAERQLGHLADVLGV